MKNRIERYKKDRTLKKIKGDSWDNENKEPEPEKQLIVENLHFLPSMPHCRYSSVSQSDGCFLLHSSWCLQKGERGKERGKGD